MTAMFKFPHKSPRGSVVQHPLNSNMVIVSGKGDMSRDMATYLGYAVPPAVNEEQAAKDSRLDDIASLPEARGKVRSAMRLANDYSAEAMPLERAKAFLRGAPTDAELAAQRQVPAPTATAPALDAKEARKAELRATAKAYMGRQ